MSHARTLTLAVFVAASSAHAHLMAAQHGTLNVVGDGAFLVLSVPASALSMADVDADGRLSSAELASHQAAVTEAIVKGVTLRDDTGVRTLEGVMLSLVAPEDAPEETGRQLVALGRFPVEQTKGALRLHLGLYGPEGATEYVTVTRGAEAQLLAFTPTHAEQLVLPTKLVVLRQYVGLGLTHILTGLDHLLFLLVVLAAGGSLRRLALTLTCFTVGHAVTLALSLYGPWHAPSSVVEPTIAATIIVMAFFDWKQRRQGRTSNFAARLALVFACALVHGLGLAASLTDVGLDPAHVPAVLLGFNVGVELGQFLVCVAVGVVVSAVSALAGRTRTVALARLSEVMAVIVAGAWFFQRVL